MQQVTSTPSKTASGKLRNWSVQNLRKKKTGQHIQSFTASIQNLHSEMCVDVSRVSHRNGANIHQWNCDYKGNQRITFTPVPEKPHVYTLVFEHSGKCLDVSRRSTSNLANIHQWVCHGETNQQFKLEPLGDDLYKIIAEHSGKVLDVKALSTQKGGNIIQYSYHSGANQKWRLLK